MYIHVTFLHGCSAGHLRLTRELCGYTGRALTTSVLSNKCDSLSSPVSMQNEPLADDVTPGAEKGACQDSPSPSEITDTASPPELTHHTLRNTDTLRTRFTRTRSPSHRDEGLWRSAVTFSLAFISCTLRTAEEFIGDLGITLLFGM